MWSTCRRRSLGRVAQSLGYSYEQFFSRYSGNGMTWIRAQLAKKNDKMNQVCSQCQSLGLRRPHRLKREFRDSVFSTYYRPRIPTIYQDPLPHEYKTPSLFDPTTPRPMTTSSCKTREYQTPSVQSPPHSPTMTHPPAARRALPGKITPGVSRSPAASTPRPYSSAAACPSRRASASSPAPRPPPPSAAWRTDGK